MDGSRPDSAGGFVDVEELRQVERSEVMDGLEGEKKIEIINAIFDREPAKLLKDGGDVINGGDSGDDVSGTVLDQLEFMDGLESGAKGRGGCSSQCRM